MVYGPKENNVISMAIYFDPDSSEAAFRAVRRQNKVCFYGISGVLKEADAEKRTKMEYDAILFHAMTLLDINERHYEWAKSGYDKRTDMVKFGAWIDEQHRKILKKYKAIGPQEKITGRYMDDEDDQPLSNAQKGIDNSCGALKFNIGQVLHDDEMREIYDDFKESLQERLDAYVEESDEYKYLDEIDDIDDVETNPMHLRPLMMTKLNPAIAGIITRN